MIKINQELSNKLANMSFVCSIFVVIIHNLTIAESSSWWWIYEPIHSYIARIAVPFFFICSGFLLAGHIGENGWYKSALTKRLYTLIIPFFLWIFISACLKNPLNILADIHAHRPITTNLSLLHTSILGQIGLDLFELPHYHGALWYVRALFVLVLLSPIIHWLVSRFKWKWIIFCSIAYFTYKF